MDLKLYPHNQKAYEKAEYMLDKYKKAAVIHPTGTGKSFIAFAVIANHMDKSILWLSPSEYIYQTQLENLKKVTECTENPFHNVTFHTYAWLLANQEKTASLHADYIILDEFHRCGAAKWEHSIRALIKNNRKAKILGLSATSIRYLDNQRDMASEIFNGYIASEITLGEAVSNKLLPSPTYIISVFSYEEKIENYQEQISTIRNHTVRKYNQALLDKLKRNLSNASGIEHITHKYFTKPAKILVFCSSKKHIEEMISVIPGWFKKIDESPHVYAIYNDQPANDKNFYKFIHDDSQHIRLMFSIEMLNEGIHIKDVDAVILLRPTTSPIIFQQQIGRALACGTKSKPIILDLVNNIENLKNIESFINTLPRTFRVYAPSAKNIPSKIHSFYGIQIHDELLECRTLFEKIECSLESSWDIYYDALKFYKEIYDNTDVPKRYHTEDGLGLGRWVQQQRINYRLKAHTMSAKKIEKMNEIGFEWESLSDRKFTFAITEIKKFMKKNGHVQIPGNYICDNGFHLGKWLGNQRTKYRTGTLSAERFAQLNDLGIMWNVLEETWQLCYLEAVKYYQEYGNLKIPKKYITDSGIRLGQWIRTQRRVYNGTILGNLNDEKINKLNKIEMIWDGRYEYSVENKIAKIQDFYETTGLDINVPARFKSDTDQPIGKWIYTIRKKYAEGALSKENIEIMEKCRIVW